jgi:hypothetical protein
MPNPLKTTTSPVPARANAQMTRQLYQYQITCLLIRGKKAAMSWKEHEVPLVYLVVIR